MTGWCCGRHEDVKYKHLAPPGDRPLVDGDPDTIAANIRKVDFTAPTVAVPREAHFIVRVTDKGARPSPATSG